MQIVTGWGGFLNRVVLNIVKMKAAGDGALFLVLDAMRSIRQQRGYYYTGLETCSRRDVDKAYAKRGLEHYNVLKL